MIFPHIKRSHKISLLILLLISLSAFSMTYGSVSLSFEQVMAGFFGPADEPYSIIVRELRLPRILLGLMAGATLGLSGAALQGLLRNPLADPGIIGISASAGLGAVIAIYMGLGGLWALATPVSAMTGALLATAILFLLAARDASILTLILCGIGISSLASASIALVMNFALHSSTLQDMVLWMLGSLENRTTDDVMLAAPFMILGWILMLGVGQGLDAISLGEDAARSLGINLSRLRWQVVIGTALSVGATVSICGAIGFVGLVVPHMMRAFFGANPRALLLPSALGGAILLSFADIITRMPFAHVQLRLGVVTAFIGAPLFLYIIFRTRENMR